jgi:hypothetical protein
MRRWIFRIALVSILLAAVSAPVSAGQKKRKDEEPKPQVLPLPKELPRAQVVDSRTLGFRVTPLLKNGRLSVQIKDTLANLLRDTHNGTIVKLRAFVAGAGDSRRVQELVSEMFSEKKLPLPVLTLIQVGALGNETSAIVMEAVVAGKKVENTNGLAFLAGQSGPSLDTALSKVAESMKAANLSSGDVISTTCFASRFGDYPSMLNSLTTAFPHAAVNLVQAVRDPFDSRCTCEAVARISNPGKTESRRAADSRVFLVPGSQVVFTGLQLSFGTYLDDANSALSRLARDLESVHVDIRDAVSINAFSLNPAAVSALQKTMPKFDIRPDTLTIQPVEGLPSLDAALGMEAVLAPASGGGFPQRTSLVGGDR